MEALMFVSDHPHAFPQLNIFLIFAGTCVKNANFAKKIKNAALVAPVVCHVRHVCNSLQLRVVFPGVFGFSFMVVPANFVCCTVIA
jgi:hypothetical protein